MLSAAVYVPVSHRKYYAVEAKVLFFLQVRTVPLGLRMYVRMCVCHPEQKLDDSNPGFLSISKALAQNSSGTAAANRT